MLTRDKPNIHVGAEGNPLDTKSRYLHIPNPTLPRLDERKQPVGSEESRPEPHAAQQETARFRILLGVNGEGSDIWTRMLTIGTRMIRQT
jgi:hypothetical protein